MYVSIISAASMSIHAFDTVLKLVQRYKIKFASRLYLILFNLTQALASQNELTLVKIAQYLAAQAWKKG